MTDHESVNNEVQARIDALIDDEYLQKVASVNSLDKVKLVLYNMVQNAYMGAIADRSELSNSVLFDLIHKWDMKKERETDRIARLLLLIYGRRDDV